MKERSVFQCPGFIIPSHLQCDGINNCGDNSDEENCPTGFYCDWDTNLQFPFPSSLRCDGTNNCGDNSDEANCSVGKKLLLLKYLASTYVFYQMLCPSARTKYFLSWTKSDLS